MATSVPVLHRNKTNSKTWTRQQSFVKKQTKLFVLVTRSSGCSGATPVGKNSKWSNNPSDDESPPASPTRDGGARTRNKLRGTPLASASSSGMLIFVMLLFSKLMKSCQNFCALVALRRFFPIKIRQEIWVALRSAFLSSTRKHRWDEETRPSCQKASRIRFRWSPK